MVSTGRVAVLIPGILGSVLQDGTGSQIWSSDFLQNYDTLLRNPGLLSWAGVKAKARLLKTARMTYVVYKEWPLWDAILKEGRFPPDFGEPPRFLEFGYDWRQSNVESAQDLGLALASFLGFGLADPPKAEQTLRLTFIMHSMGGLVARIAIAKRLIHAKWIDRLIHIGTPLFGAPSSFGTLFSSDDDDILPLLSTFIKFSNRRNTSKFREILTSSIRTCPSIYELLPRAHVPFLILSPLRHVNPLNEDRMDARLRQLAINATIS